ncbi:hypothetical protein [Candidatus Nitrotoga sp. HW29]|uniref:hypothetical protein n=1 Tax=Candidatus Nitrotoga sp. HW29 TaxID=2886963 RepID=UPI001EF1CB7B|nr:hypothetical protein [Candidatus Nitrotoga sp. HW29]
MSSYRAKKFFWLIAYDLSGITQLQKRHQPHSLTQARASLQGVPFICCNIEQINLLLIEMGSINLRLPDLIEKNYDVFANVVGISV